MGRLGSTGYFAPVVWLAFVVAFDGATFRGVVSTALETVLTRGGSEHDDYPSPPTEPGAYNVRITDTRQIVPGDGLPRSVRVDHANNNLDVVRHTDGRVYLAWRTAPDHYASAKTRIVVVSSQDERSWRKEHEIFEGRDLREPRLLSLDGRLFLYVSVLGTHRFRFEPRGIHLSERNEQGHWGALEPLDRPGYLAWRTRTENGIPYMTAYRGGEQIYSVGESRMAVELWTTRDGRNWHALPGANPVVDVGGGSEADFTFTAKGKLFGVIRNEAGDRTGWGSKVCTAPPGAPTQWRCRPDPRKFDSPLVFRWGSEIYLVARRNVTPTGHYDHPPPMGLESLRTFSNQLDYVLRRKRCSLWRWVADEERVAFVLDLPSRGDTCFPAWTVGSDPNTVVLYNYSSPLDGPDSSWVKGQHEPTHIYRHVLRLSP